MDFEFAVRASVDRVEGKFASRDEIERHLQEALDEANPQSIDTDEDAQYEVQDWTVEPGEGPKQRKAGPQGATTPQLLALAAKAVALYWKARPMVPATGLGEGATLPAPPSNDLERTLEALGNALPAQLVTKARVALRDV